MFFELTEKMLKDLRIDMKDTIVAWAGEQGFFPTDEQIAVLVAKLADKQVAATQKITNNLINMVADKNCVIDIINKHWPMIESKLRVAQALLISPLPETDPTDLMILFSEDKHEKGDEEKK